MAGSPSVASWLEEILGGWTLPVVALAAGGGAWVLFVVGFLAEPRAAAVVAGAVALACALVVVRPAARAGADPIGRWLAAAAAAGTLAVTALPAIATVSPGTPLAEGDLAGVGEALPLPAPASGPVRLLVRAHLPPSGMPRILFRITGGASPAEGSLQRTASSARVGRGARTTVTHDHSATYVPARIAEGTAALRLDRLAGEPDGPLHVSVYRDWLPFDWLVALAIAIVVLAAVADARLGVKDQGGAAAAIAVAFGVLVAQNATPQAAVGESIASLAVAVFAGGIGGWLVGLLTRRLVPARRAPGRGAAQG